MYYNPKFYSKLRPHPQNIVTSDWLEYWLIDWLIDWSIDECLIPYRQYCSHVNVDENTEWKMCEGEATNRYDLQWLPCGLVNHNCKSNDENATLIVFRPRPVLLFCHSFVKVLCNLHIGLNWPILLLLLSISKYIGKENNKMILFVFWVICGYQKKIRITKRKKNPSNLVFRSGHWQK